MMNPYPPDEEVDEKTQWNLTISYGLMLFYTGSLIWSPPWRGGIFREVDYGK